MNQMLNEKSRFFRKYYVTLVIFIMFIALCMRFSILALAAFVAVSGYFIWRISTNDNKRKAEYGYDMIPDLIFAVLFFIGICNLQPGWKLEMLNPWTVMDTTYSQSYVLLYLHMAHAVLFFILKEESNSPFILPYAVVSVMIGGATVLYRFSRINLDDAAVTGIVVRFFCISYMLLLFFSLIPLSWNQSSIKKRKILLSTFVIIWCYAVTHGISRIVDVAAGWHKETNLILTWHYLWWIPFILCFGIAYRYIKKHSPTIFEKEENNREILVCLVSMVVFFQTFLLLKLDLIYNWGITLFLFYRLYTEIATFRAGTDVRSRMFEILRIALCSAFGMYLAYYSLWFNLVQLFVWMYLFRDIQNEWKKPEAVYMAILGIFVQFMGFAMAFRNSIHVFIMMIIILSVGMFAAFVLNTKLPKGFEVHTGYKIGLLMVFILVNSVLFHRYGTDIRMYKYNDKLGVVVEARGKDNEIVEKEIFWTTPFGERVGSSSGFGKEIESDINSVRVVVKTVDKYGITTWRTNWFPKIYR